MGPRPVVRRASPAGHPAALRERPRGDRVAGRRGRRRALRAEGAALAASAGARVAVRRLPGPAARGRGQLRALFCTGARGRERAGAAEGGLRAAACRGWA